MIKKEHELISVGNTIGKGIGIFSRNMKSIAAPLK
jgi:ABC-type metal ion transport system substrate-binding protein